MIKKLSYFLILFLIASSSAFAGKKAPYHPLAWDSLRTKERAQQPTDHQSELIAQVRRRHTVKLTQTGFLKRHRYQFASPVISGQTLFVGVDAEKFYAVDTKAMKKKWTISTEGGVHAPAAVGDVTVYFGDAKGFAYAVDSDTGRERWKVRLDDSIFAAPFFADDRVYITTASGRLYAFQASSGQELWHTQPREKPWGFSVRRASSPRLVQGHILMGTSNGEILAYRKEDGTLVYAKPLGDSRALLFDVDAFPLVVGDRVFMASADGSLYSLSPADGRIIWSQEAGGANDLFFLEGMLYVSGQGVLSAVNPDTGDFVWRQDFTEPEISSPTGSPSFLAVTSTNKKIYLIDPKTGDIMYQQFIAGGSLSDPLAVENDIYTLTNSGRLLSFHVKAIRQRNQK